MQQALIKYHHYLLANNVVKYEIEALRQQKQFGSYEYGKQFSFLDHCVMHDDGFFKNQY